MLIKDKKGFTLVELLIITGLIAIIVAISLPQMSQYRKKAAKSNAEESIKACIAKAVGAYADTAATAETCAIGQSSITLSMNILGDITTTSVSLTIKGIALDCTITPATGIVECAYL